MDWGIRWRLWGGCCLFRLGPYRKAFDTVPHKQLLVKLEIFGIVGDIYQWIKEFLSNREMRVTLNNSVTDWINVTNGVPQDSVLGPFLFLIYVNDILEVIKSSIKLFADDNKVCKVVKMRMILVHYRKIWILLTNGVKNGCSSLILEVQSNAHWQKYWEPLLSH